MPGHDWEQGCMCLILGYLAPRWPLTPLSICSKGVRLFWKTGHQMNLRGSVCVSTVGWTNAFSFSHLTPTLSTQQRGQVLDSYSD